MTHVKALQAGHSSQGTSEPITPVLIIFCMDPVLYHSPSSISGRTSINKRRVVVLDDSSSDEGSITTGPCPGSKSPSPIPSGTRKRAKLVFEDSSGDEMPAVDRSFISATRNNFFRAVQLDLEEKTSFTELYAAVKSWQSQMEDYKLSDSVPKLQNLHPDTKAMQLYPSDASSHLSACEIYGDGNCLPRAISVTICGSQDLRVEMRVRMTVEMTLHSKLYMENNFF